MTWVKDFMARTRVPYKSPPRERTLIVGGRSINLQLDADRFVYFAQSGKAGPIKIGFSEHPVRRLTELQSANPRSLTLLGVVHGGEPLEQTLHSLLNSERMSGEWFHPTLITIKVIHATLKQCKSTTADPGTLVQFIKRIAGIEEVPT